MCKFGGSSCANVDAIKNIEKVALDKDRKVLVFSAIGKSGEEDEKVTDMLFACYQKYLKSGVLDFDKIKEKFNCLKKNLGVQIDLDSEFSQIEHALKKHNSCDYLVSRGEYLTAKMFALKLKIPYVPSENLLIFENEKVNFAFTKKNIKNAIKKCGRIVTGGFYGSDEKGDIKLLSRGGGDLSGAIFAKVLGVDTYEIFTDVDGVYPLNPKFGKTVQMKYLSYKDLIYMTNYDAKVVHNQCGKVLQKTDIMLVVRNCFDLAKKGTIVSKIPTSGSYIVFNEKRKKFILTNSNKRRTLTKKEEQNLIKCL